MTDDGAVSVLLEALTDCQDCSAYIQRDAGMRRLLVAGDDLARVEFMVRKFHETGHGGPAAFPLEDLIACADCSAHARPGGELVRMISAGSNAVEVAATIREFHAAGHVS